MDSSLLTVAAVQASPVLLDRDATTDKALRLIKQATGSGARLVAFPEAWIPGYPNWIYGATGWEDPASKRVFGRLQRNAVTVPSATTDALRRAARQNHVNLVIGIHERDAAFSRGTLYNSLLYISEEGEILGVHRKLLPTHAERILWGQGDGSTLHVFDTAIGRIGGLICWEHWMPLARFAMHAKGEQLHVAAWPDLPDVHEVASRSYAFEGRCFVISASSYMTIQDIPPNFEIPDAMSAGGGHKQAGEILPGGSGVIGPDGRWIAGPVFGKEAIVVAEVDLDRIGDEQQALDAAGHYNRPDIFQLIVDVSPKPQVSWRLPGEPTGAANSSGVRGTSGRRGQPEAPTEAIGSAAPPLQATST